MNNLFGGSRLFSMNLLLGGLCLLLLSKGTGFGDGFLKNDLSASLGSDLLADEFALLRPVLGHSSLELITSLLHHLNLLTQGLGLLRTSRLLSSSLKFLIRLGSVLYNDRLSLFLLLFDRRLVRKQPLMVIQGLLSHLETFLQQGNSDLVDFDVLIQLVDVI